MLTNGKSLIIICYQSMLQGCPFAMFGFTVIGTAGRTNVNANQHSADGTSGQDDIRSVMSEYVDDQEFKGTATAVANMMIDSVTSDLSIGRTPCLEKMTIASKSRTTLASTEWDRLEETLSTILAVPRNTVNIERAYIGEDGGIDDGYVKLGCAHGNIHYRRAYVQKKADSAIESIKMMTHLTLQERFILVRFCSIARMEFHARINEPSVTNATMIAFDDFISGADGIVWKWLDVDYGQLTAEEQIMVKETVYAPIGYGGQGLRSMERVSEYAFVSAMGDALQTPYAKATGLEGLLKTQYVEEGGHLTSGSCNGDIRTSPTNPNTTVSNTITTIANMLHHLNTKYANVPNRLINPATSPLVDDDNEDETTTTTAPTSTPIPESLESFLNNHTFYYQASGGDSSQKKSGRIVNRAAFLQMTDTITDPNQILRIASQAQTGAMTCTVAFPSGPLTTFNNDDYRATVRERLGLTMDPRMDQLDGEINCVCGPHTSYNRWHIPTCMAMGHRRANHDRLVRALTAMALDLLPTATVYTDNQLIQHFDDTMGSSHPDLMIDLNDGTRPIIVDFTTGELSTKFPGTFGATNAGEDRKNRIKKYQDAARDHNLVYYGISISSTGAYGAGMKRFLKYIHTHHLIAARRSITAGDSRHDGDFPALPDYEDLTAAAAITDFTTNPYFEREQDHSTWHQPSRFQYHLQVIDCEYAKGRVAQITGILNHNDKVLRAAIMPRGAPERLSLNAEHHISRIIAHVRTQTHTDMQRQPRLFSLYHADRTEHTVKMTRHIAALELMLAQRMRQQLPHIPHHLHPNNVTVLTNAQPTPPLSPAAALQRTLALPTTTSNTTTATSAQHAHITPPRLVAALSTTVAATIRSPLAVADDTINTAPPTHPPSTAAAPLLSPTRPDTSPPRTVPDATPTATPAQTPARPSSPSATTPKIIARRSSPSFNLQLPRQTPPPQSTGVSTASLLPPAPVLVPVPAVIAETAGTNNHTFSRPITQAITAKSSSCTKSTPPDHSGGPGD